MNKDMKHFDEKVQSAILKVIRYDTSKSISNYF